MNSIWISNPWMITKTDYIDFTYQRDNKEDRLQRDGIWISDTYLD